MTDQEILHEAIKKAVRGGFTPPLIGIISESRLVGKNTFWFYFHRGIIFSHDFAKAFWNVDEPCDDCKYEPSIDCSECVSWSTRLQQMVIEPNPIKYLEKFL